MSRLHDQIFSNQAQVWLHDQLEPDQVLRGNAKQYREIVIKDRTFRIGEPPHSPLSYTKPAAKEVDVNAVEAAEDEYLKSKGII